MDQVRVDTWKDFVGQTMLKDRLSIHIASAVAQGHMLDHILLTGPPGFGKTSLATIIAKELGYEFISLTMPVDERTMISMIQEVDNEWEPTVLLLDEIHRGSKKEQESLLPLLESGYIQDRRGRKHSTNLITVIGATTEPDKVIAPLFDRFPTKPVFEEYTNEEMGLIVAGMAIKIKLEFSIEVSQKLGKATGGIPRNARQFVLAARDLQHSLNRIPIAEEVMILCRVDEIGLSAMHYKYLRALVKLGSTAGLKPIQSVLQIPDPTVRDLERLLFKFDLIEYTESGRSITQAGLNKLKAERK